MCVLSSQKNLMLVQFSAIRRDVIFYQTVKDYTHKLI